MTITLNDCLACSGCVTSAETVLITQQSQHELYRVLSDNSKAREVLALVLLILLDASHSQCYLQRSSLVDTLKQTYQIKQ